MRYDRGEDFGKKDWCLLETGVREGYIKNMVLLKQELRDFIFYFVSDYLKIKDKKGKKEGLIFFWRRKYVLFLQFRV